MYVNLIILYKQLNFGLVPQTFGLVASSNSLPEGQPHLFIFVPPCTVRVHVKCLAKERNTMSPAKAKTWTAQSGVKLTNYEATVPPTKKFIKETTKQNFYIDHTPWGWR